MGKKLFALVLALLLSISMGVPALAAQGFISIEMKYGDKAVPGGTMTLCRVGIARGTRYALTVDFADSGVSLEKLNADTAAALAAYAKAHSISGTTQGIDEQGEAVFSGLAAGLYLLYQKDAAEGYEPVNPFLVTVPLKGRYDVNATPKMEQPDKPDQPDPERKTGGLAVYKEVTGQGDKNRAFTFTVTLSSSSVNGTYGDMEFRNGAASFTLKHGERIRAAGLPAGLGYTVTESGNEGYTVTSSGSTGNIPEDNTAWVTFRNHIGGGSDPDPSYTQLTVKKVWKLDDGGKRTGSVTVALLKNGEQTETVTLSAANGWTHTWSDLDDSYIWTVKEIDVPDGFTAAIDRNGMTFIITNDDKPVPPDGPDDPDTPDEPEDPDMPEEPDRPDEPDIPDTPNEPDTPDDEPGASHEPQTGDQSLTSLWAGLCLLALGGMGLLARQSRREKKDE